MVLTDRGPTEARQGFHLPIKTKPHDRPTALVTVDPDLGTSCPVGQAYLPVWTPQPKSLIKLNPAA
jgi:hypothetical protein